VGAHTLVQNLVVFLGGGVFLFSRAKTPVPIFLRSIRQMTSFRSFRTRMCLLGVPKTKVYISTPFPPRRQFLANFWRDLEIFASKGLNVAMLTCKLPLIVVVAPSRVNRQIWGQRRPPIYRSRDPAKFWTKNQLKKALKWDAYM